MHHHSFVLKVFLLQIWISTNKKGKILKTETKLFLNGKNISGKNNIHLNI